MALKMRATFDSGNASTKFRPSSSVLVSSGSMGTCPMGMKNNRPELEIHFCKTNKDQQWRKKKQKKQKRSNGCQYLRKECQIRRPRVSRHRWRIRWCIPVKKKTEDDHGYTVELSSWNMRHVKSTITAQYYLLHNSGKHSHSCFRWSREWAVTLSGKM